MVTVQQLERVDEVVEEDNQVLVAGVSLPVTKKIFAPSKREYESDSIPTFSVAGKSQQAIAVGGGSNRKKNQEQVIYDHLLSYVRESSPEEMINRFRALFIEGNYTEYEIKAALDRLAAVKKADQEFKFILNRCCHILINHWRRQPQLQGAIPGVSGAV